MQASFFLGAQSTPKFEVRTLSLAEPGAEEVLVQVKSCGVCGTDVHIYHGEAGSAAVVPPVVLGHEFSGVITKVGSRVTTLRPGDHVAVDPNAYCGLCRPCRMGKKQNCEHLYALGVNANGGFAEYALCPAKQCFRVNDTVPFDVAAMAEPLACVLHGLARANIQLGQTVLVIGGGTIGLLMVQLAKRSGAAAVILSEPVAMRRELALQLGADGVIDPGSEPLDARLNALLHAPGADVVIECVGSPIAAQQAIASAGPGGTVLLFSVPAPQVSIPLPLFDVYKKELRILGSIINPDTQQQAVNLINTGALELLPLITHTFGLSQLDEAIQTQLSSASIKVMVHP